MNVRINPKMIPGNPNMNASPKITKNKLDLYKPKHLSIPNSYTLSYTLTNNNVFNTIHDNNVSTHTITRNVLSNKF